MTHNFSKQAELDFMHNFSHVSEGDRWAKHEIESLRQQLATANTAFDVVQKDCWNLTEKVIPNLRQQLADAKHSMHVALEVQESLRQKLALAREQLDLLGGND